MAIPKWQLENLRMSEDRKRRDEIKQLQAKNKRLREALEKINPSLDCCLSQDDAIGLQEIIEQALKQE